MRSRLRGAGIASLAALCICTRPVAAQEPSPPPSPATQEVAAPDTLPRFELTGAIARRFGGLVRVPRRDSKLPLDVPDAGAWELGLGWRSSRTLRWQLSYSRQSTELLASPRPPDNESIADLRIQYLHAGVRVEPAPGSSPRPLLEAGLGAAIFSSRSVREAHPSLALAIGALADLDRRVAVSAAFRFYTTLLPGNDRFLCGGPGSPCLITSNDTVFLQLQLSAGVVVRL